MRTALFEIIHKPLYQATVFLLLTVLCLAVVGAKNIDKAWVYAGFIYAAFLLVNSILISYAPNVWGYFFMSLGASVVYIILVGVLMPLVIKLLKIEGSGESSMFFIIVIYHPFTLLVMMFLKWAYVKFF